MLMITNIEAQMDISQGKRLSYSELQGIWAFKFKIRDAPKNKF